MPDGSAESFTSDIEWIGCNLSFAPAQWENARQRADSLGVKVIPWVRLAHEGDSFEDVKTKLNLLISTAQVWGSDTIIPNYEVEAGWFSPAAVADYLYGYANWDGKTGWSTLAWLQNDVDWSPIVKDPVLLQIFPKDNGWPVSEVNQKMGDCVAHARDEGFTYVGVTYQTYGDAVPGWFDVESHQHSTFPGNLIAHGQWGSWYR